MGNLTPTGGEAQNGGGGGCNTGAGLFAVALSVLFVAYSLRTRKNFR